MASTGLSSQNSAMPASRAIARLVPTCRMASTSGPSTSRIASRSSLLRHMRDRDRAGAAESLQAHDLEAAIGEEAAHLRVADRHVGRDHPEPARAVAFERRLAGVGAHRDLDAGARLDPLAQLDAAVAPVPEGLRRHAHDQVVGLAGHHAVDRLHHGAADIVHHPVEFVVVAHRIVGDMDAAEMVGDAARPHGVELGLHRGVGRRRDHAEFLAEAQGVGHRRHAVLLREARKVSGRRAARQAQSVYDRPADRGRRASRAPDQRRSCRACCGAGRSIWSRCATGASSMWAASGSTT